MNRITTKPQRKTAIRAAAVIGTAVLGLTAACGENGKDASSVSEASSAAAAASSPSVASSPSALAPASPSVGASSPSAGSASPSGVAAAAPYVLNQLGEKAEKEGSADRRPAKLVLSEFTTISSVDWKRWGTDEAVGTGEATGTWCLETCQDKPLKATITLTDPKTVNGRTFFSAFALKLSGDTKAYDAEDLKGKRQLGTP